MVMMESYFSSKNNGISFKVSNFCFLDLLRKEKTNLHCFIPRVTIGIEQDPFDVYNIPLIGGAWMSRSQLHDDPKVNLLFGQE